MDFRRFLPDVKPWTVREIACAAGLLALSAGAGYCIYRCLRRGGAPPAHTQPTDEPLDVLEESVDPPSILQDVEPNLPSLPTEIQHEPSAVSLPVGAGELMSSWCNVQFLSADFHSSHSQSVNDRKYYLGMIRVGQQHTSTWVQEDTQYSPHGDAEESEYNLSPEEMEVPFMSCHLIDRGVTDVGMKLPAVRQAFSTLLASIHHQNFLFVVGKKIVMGLAAANNQVVGVQLAYEALIRFLRRPANQVSIEAELSGVQLYHYNFLDVFFELLLFGHFRSSAVPEAITGGFLERLLELVSMWDVSVWEPAAEQYITVLIDELTVLCEVLFTQHLEMYADPAALASTVSDLIRQHVQLMMDTLERL